MLVTPGCLTLADMTGNDVALQAASPPARSDAAKLYRRDAALLVRALALATGRPDPAGDAVAEAFVRAIERWDRVGRLGEPAGWVLRTALNVARRRLRRETLERRLLARFLPERGHLDGGTRSRTLRPCACTPGTTKGGRRPALRRRSAPSHKSPDAGRQDDAEGALVRGRNSRLHDGTCMRYHDGMIRTQIQFTEKQTDGLRRLAGARSQSTAAVVRDAVDLLLSQVERDSHRQRLLGAIGGFRSDESTIARDHDDWLADDFL